MAVESSKESRVWFVGTELEPSRDNFRLDRTEVIQKHNLEASNDQLPYLLINAETRQLVLNVRLSDLPGLSAEA